MLYRLSWWSDDVTKFEADFWLLLNRLTLRSIELELLLMIIKGGLNIIIHKLHWLETDGRRLVIHYRLIGQWTIITWCQLNWLNRIKLEFDWSWRYIKYLLAAKTLNSIGSIKAISNHRSRCKFQEIGIEIFIVVHSLLNPYEVWINLKFRAVN